MCGIVGYVGKRNAQDVLLDDLEKLEDFSKQLDIIAEGYKAQGL